MKTRILAVTTGALALTLLTGCLELRFGGGSRTDTKNSDQHPVVGQQMVAPTVGQQLIDLQKAKDAGAISDPEYQEQRAKLLGGK